ncbi:hypothetical protein D9M70_530170 [compost metagenome]
MAILIPLEAAFPFFLDADILQKHGIVRADGLLYGGHDRRVVSLLLGPRVVLEHHGVLELEMGSAYGLAAGLGKNGAVQEGAKSRFAKCLVQLLSGGLRVAQLAEFQYRVGVFQRAVDTGRNDIPVGLIERFQAFEVVPLQVQLIRGQPLVAGDHVLVQGLGGEAGFAGDRADQDSRDLQGQCS